MHTIGQTEVPQNNGPAPHSAMRTNAGTASHTDAASHGGVFANVHVVANLNEVV